MFAKVFVNGKMEIATRRGERIDFVYSDAVLIGRSVNRRGWRATITRGDSTTRGNPYAAAHDALVDVVAEDELR